MTNIQRLREILAEEVAELKEQVAFEEHETHYLDGKIFAHESTIAKIDELER